MSLSFENDLPSDMHMQDMYAKVAWSQYWPKRDYTTFIDLCEKDRRAGKLSPAFTLRLAHGYAVTGKLQHAISLVDAAYRIEPGLKDGYARCAYGYYWPREEYGSFIALCEKERTAGRFSPAYRIYLARAYAYEKNLNAAQKLVREEYSDSSATLDGWAAIAWAYYYPQRAWVRLLALIEQDSLCRRLSSKGLLLKARALAFTGDLQAALDVAVNLYHESIGLTDVYGLVRQAYHIDGLNRDYNWQAVIGGYEHDCLQGWISCRGWMRLAELYARGGDLANAERCLHKAESFQRTNEISNASLCLALQYARPSNLNGVADAVGLLDEACQTDQAKKRHDDKLSRQVWAAKHNVHHFPPVILASYCRSGSNFLQHVTEESTGYACGSLYDSHLNPLSCILLKSHALTYHHMLLELERIHLVAWKPKKIIVLIRDPRDVLFSFKKYATFRYDQPLSFEQFLMEGDYYTFADIRRVFPNEGRVSPVEAYRCHVKNWFLERQYPAGVEVLNVYYEELCRFPRQQFQRIFDFIGLPNSVLQQAALTKKVALYGENAPYRGVPSQWQKRETADIPIIEKELSQELQQLNYK